MNALLRILSWLGSTRNARETFEMARGSARKIKESAEGYRTASFQRLREKAEAGDAAAEYSMGEYYYDGGAVARDFEEAFRWFLRAAERGHAQGRCNVGLMLSLGRGVEPNTKQAIHWLSLAAEQGNEPAAKALEKLRRRSYARCPSIDMVHSACHS